MKIIDPTTGTAIRDVLETDSAVVQRRLQTAAECQRSWRRTPFRERAELLVRVAERLIAGRDEHARRMTREMGKPIGQGLAEVDKCAWACRHFAEHAERDLADQPVASDGSRSLIRYQPLGVLFAVMPWNFPFWQVFRCAAPAVMVGNAVVLKHASNVPGSAEAIERVFVESGAPDGLFTTLLISANKAEVLIDRPEIHAVTLTGSEAAGRAIGRRAGGALKKTVLELGGSDAFIVLADADVETAAEQAAASRLVNNGQSCIAAKRFIVEAGCAEAFEAAFVARMAAVKVGDPLDPATELGPLARGDLREELHAMVSKSVQLGARVRTGGAPLPGPGFFFAPTVITKVEPGMPVFDEETFGPIGAVVRARDRAHAIELANRSRYGLGASVWTRDPDSAETLARELEVGMVFVNGMVKSDPRLPFGGIKASGYGRELSTVGLREFVNMKTIWMK